MKLYNSLTKNIQEFTPKDNKIGIYSCGPTVYDRPHIGNLSTFIYADLLRRVLRATFSDAKIIHVMNITDVDDKTIRDSKEFDGDPLQSLLSYTRKYEDVFKADIERIGNDVQGYSFIRATDSIDDMLRLITELYEAGISYITDDGVYFSISAYKNKGKTYGQLVQVSVDQAAKARIANDEYDKDSAQDFALWKLAKEGEPSWDYNLDGKDLHGRPGWHIECSAMSKKLLGERFDIHTGGIDLKFPHHENEIAQSTACSANNVMADFFVHNEHILVDGTKMSKSLGNFYTLRDVEEKGYDPMAFRLLVLQGHYRNSINFSWENLESAQNRILNWRNIAAIRWQSKDAHSDHSHELLTAQNSIRDSLQNDLDTPSVLREIEEALDLFGENISIQDSNLLSNFLEFIDEVLGLSLLESTPDISDNAKQLLNERQQARDAKEWQKSDDLRDELKRHGITVRDAQHGQVWTYASSVIDSQYFCG